MAENAFASTVNLPAKTVSFTEIGPDPYASAAESDRNSGIIASNITYDLIAKRDRNMWGDLGETDTP
jgi:hypothetical protein